MSGKTPKTGRRAFLALGVSAVLAGCVSRSGGGSSDSTTMRDGESTSSSPVSTTIPDQTSTRGAKQTPTTKATTPEATTTWGTERDDTDNESVEIKSDENFPQTTATVGDTSADGSATMLVWNDAETARKIRVAITERNSGVSVFRKTYRLEADAYIEIELTTPGKYTLEVGVDGDEPTTVDFFVDTCNSERITVAVRGDGAVNWEWLSTAVGCR